LVGLGGKVGTGKRGGASGFRIASGSLGIFAVFDRMEAARMGDIVGTAGAIVVEERSNGFLGVENVANCSAIGVLGVLSCAVLDSSGTGGGIGDDHSCGGEPRVRVLFI
jgi:hypothetical protein